MIEDYDYFQEGIHLAEHQVRGGKKKYVLHEELNTQYRFLDQIYGSLLPNEALLKFRLTL